VAAQAATEEDFATMLAQMQALSDRLDRLEAENKTLTAANAELTINTQQTAASVAAVSDKIDAVVAEVEERA
jgi:hypothetical protein